MHVDMSTVMINQPVNNRYLEFFIYLVPHIMSSTFCVVSRHVRPVHTVSQGSVL